MSVTLWDKGDSIDEKVHAFTVGEDPKLDLSIARWDAIASAAHATMLAEIGLLNKADLAPIKRALSKIVEEVDAGKFVISPELEDCHTVIEARLTEELGELGKKIHAGRSRNDQVLVALRLFMKWAVSSVSEKLAATAESLLSRADKEAETAMPGFTHMQAAMPSSVGMWFHAYAESLLDLQREGEKLLYLLDSNPLGVGSGFGVPLDLKRELTAKLLGFSRVERNPVHVQSGRGFWELKVVRWFSDITAVIEKCSCDLMLFSSREFGFCKIPKEFTTGSSLMPNKRNPDVIELLRGSASIVRGAESELSSLISKLPSSYHRDFQLSKAPLIRSLQIAASNLEIWQKVLENLTWDSEKLKASLSSDMYATYEALKLVREGQSFRDAYKATSEKLGKGAFNQADYTGDFSVITGVLKREISECRGEQKEIAIRNQSVLKKLVEVEKIVLQ